MEWLWKKFDDLTTVELHDALHLRERVFIVEQKCVYLDVDGRDPGAWHLLGYEGEILVAYLRVLLPYVRFPEHSLGRVVTAPEVRGRGFGKRLNEEALRLVHQEFGSVPLRISAQKYLENFYAQFGFESVGETYLEDEIPHIEMFRAATNNYWGGSK